MAQRVGSRDEHRLCRSAWLRFRGPLASRRRAGFHDSASAGVSLAGH